MRIGEKGLVTQSDSGKIKERFRQANRVWRVIGRAGVTTTAINRIAHLIVWTPANRSAGEHMLPPTIKGPRRARRTGPETSLGKRSGLSSFKLGTLQLGLRCDKPYWRKWLSEIGASGQRLAQKPNDRNETPVNQSDPVASCSSRNVFASTLPTTVVRRRVPIACRFEVPPEQPCLGQARSSAICSSVIPLRCSVNRQSFSGMRRTCQKFRRQETALALASIHAYRYLYV